MAEVTMSSFTPITETDDNDYIIMLVDGLNAKVKKTDFLSAVQSALALTLTQAGGPLTGQIYPVEPIGNTASAGINWGDRFQDFIQKNILNVWTRVFQAGDNSTKFIVRYFDINNQANTLDMVEIQHDKVIIRGNLEVSGTITRNGVVI